MIPSLTIKIYLEAKVLKKKFAMSAIRRFRGLILLFAIGLIMGTSAAYAASPIDDVLANIVVSTVAGEKPGASDSPGLIDRLLDFLLNHLLAPASNLLGSSPVSGDAVKAGGDLWGKTIVVDPGHGGSNPGATDNGIKEADVNLAIGRKLRDRLAQEGAVVFLTRDANRTVAPEGSSLKQELQARLDIAAAKHADVFVSIHANENDSPAISGAMTFYSGAANSQSAKLAASIQSALIAKTHAVDKGTSSANFYVLRNSPVPSALVETGFLSNPREAVKLVDDSYQNLVAQGISDGIVQYFSGS